MSLDPRLHPLAEIFPPLSEVELAALADDIKQHGLREPITTYRGAVLDGRNRMKACQTAGVEARFEEYDGDDPVAFVTSQNLFRRHLSLEQRALAAAKLATMKQGARTDITAVAAMSQAQAAAVMGVSVDSVQRARRVLNDGVPELVQAVERGDVAVSAAMEISRLPEAEQRGRLDNSHFRTTFTGNVEWYTPEEHIERARRVMGGIDLDPASCATAQRRVRADNFFTEDDNGLEQEWHGRVWLNPPYAQPLIQQFIEKLVEEKSAGRVSEAILLVNNSTDTAWFQIAAGCADAVCWPKGRIKFVTPTGAQAGSPAMGQAFLYFGDKTGSFAREYSSTGFVTIPANQTDDLSPAEVAA